MRLTRLRHLCAVCGLIFIHITNLQAGKTPRKQTTKCHQSRKTCTRDIIQYNYIEFKFVTAI